MHSQGKEYCDENANSMKKEGAVTLPSGLQHPVIEAAKGAQKPKKPDQVKAATYFFFSFVRSILFFSLFHCCFVFFLPFLPEHCSAMLIHSAYVFIGALSCHAYQLFSC